MKSNTGEGQEGQPSPVLDSIRKSSSSARLVVCLLKSLNFK
jgi:hypothetical protein